MFGEDPSESPRHPSPWLSRSSGGTPSPLSLPTPDSTPSTPKDALTCDRARRRSSLEDLELLEGLGEDFDSISLSKGKLRSSPQVFEEPPWTEEIMLADDAEALGELAPEVDHEGHIEYKFRLATPTSLHRLEKLRTQLAWRLREGGGTAVYELGLLDDGKIVGLPQADMEESLQTLGRMLAGIGGGRVEIARVVRIGGNGSTDNSPAPSSPTRSVFPSFDVAASSSDLDFCGGNSRISSPSSHSPSPASVVSAIPAGDLEPVSFFPPEKTDRGPTPFPSGRTLEEQAIFRRDKRDQRRLRRAEATAAVAEGRTLSPTTSPSFSSSSSSSAPSSSTISPSSSACPTPPIAIRPALRNGSSTRFWGAPPSSSTGGAAKPPRPPRRTTTKQQRQAAAAAKRAANGIPSPHAALIVGDKERVRRGEVRWVVEAVVHKGVGAGVEEGNRRRRRKSSAAGRSPPSSASLTTAEGGETSPSEEALTSTTEGEDEDEGVTDDCSSDADDPAEEGWDYLEFDLASLSSSVKSAAAAAAADRVGNGGIVRAATAKVGA